MSELIEWEEFEQEVFNADGANFKVIKSEVVKELLLRQHQKTRDAVCEELRLEKYRYPDKYSDSQCSYVLGREDTVDELNAKIEKVKGGSE